MAAHTIYSEPYGSVLVDEQVPCVITQWHSYANAKQFQVMQEYALKYFEAHSTPQRPWGWVGDVRQMGAIAQPVHEWLRQEFNPRAVTAGLCEVSVVAPDVFRRMSQLVSWLLTASPRGGS